MVDFINVVYARQLRLSIIVVLAPAWNISDDATIISHTTQLTSERIASHTIYASSLYATFYCCCC